MKQLKDFFKKLGFSDSQIAILIGLSEKETLEAADQTQLDSLQAEVSTTLKNLVLSDPKNATEANKAGYGKAKNEDEILVKTIFGLSPEEMKDKKFEDVVKLAHQKMTETVSKEKQELLKDNVELKKQIDDLNEKTIPEIRKEVDQRIEAYENDQMIIHDLGDTEKRQVLGKPEAILSVVKAQLAAKGVVIKRLDGGGYEFVHKDTGVAITNKEKNKILSKDEVLDMILDDVELKVNATPPDPGKTGKEIKKVEPPSNQQTHQETLGLSEAEEHAKFLKENPAKKTV